MRVHTQGGRRTARLRAAVVGVAAVAVGLIAVPGMAFASPDEPSSAVQQLSKASAATLAAKTARVSVSVSVLAAGKSVQVTGIGAVDFAGKTTDLRLTLPGGAGSEEVRQIGTSIYVMVPASARANLPGHTPWVRVDASRVSQTQLGSSFGMTGAQDPAAALRYLQAVASVVRVGTGTVRGVSTTHLRATVDLAKLAVAGGGQAAGGLSAAVRALGTHVLPVDVYLDAQNRVRRLGLDLSVPKQAVRLTLTEDLYDFGAPVRISAPSAAQVTDITAALVAKAQQIPRKPTGAPATGGGSTAGTQNVPELVTGGISLAAGVGLAGISLLGRRRRQAAA